MSGGCVLAAARSRERQHHHPSERLRLRVGQREAASGWATFLFPVSCLLWILTVPLVGHGCHRDDLDHEPAAAPPVVACEADPKTSR